MGFEGGKYLGEGFLYGLTIKSHCGQAPPTGGRLPLKKGGGGSSIS